MISVRLRIWRRHCRTTGFPSHSSAGAWIEETAKKADTTLVLEPTAHGAVKTARKGTGIFKVTATGVESHAGLAPQDGASAILALSEFVVAAAAVAAPERGTTVNAGLVSGGSAVNVAYEPAPVAGRSRSRR